MLGAKKEIFSLLFSFCQVFFLSVPIYYFYSGKKSYYSEGLRTTDDKYCTGKSFSGKCLCLIHWYFVSFCQIDITYGLSSQLLAFRTTLKKNLSHFTITSLQMSMLDSLNIFYFNVLSFRMLINSSVVEKELQ